MDPERFGLKVPPAPPDPTLTDSAVSYRRKALQDVLELFDSLPAWRQDEVPQRIREMIEQLPTQRLGGVRELISELRDAGLSAWDGISNPEAVIKEFAQPQYYDPKQSADDLPTVAKLIDKLGQQIDDASKHIDRRPPTLLFDMGGPKSPVPLHGIDDTVTIRPELVPTLVSKLEGAGKAAEVGT